TALAAAGLVAAALVQGPVWARGEFVVEPAVARTVAAPFDSVLEEALVEVGDRVEAGVTVLARLDSSTQQLALAQAQADAEHWRVQEALARSAGDIAQAQLARARADEAQARVDLFAARIEQATIVAPISGVVIEGDLKQQAGAPLSQGQQLFVIAPLETLQATLFLPESQYRLTREGAECELVPVAAPADKAACVVERVAPVAQERNGVRAHRAQAAIRSRPAWLRPGVTGAVRVRAGRRSYLAQWTAPLLDWFRLRFWL
ncbi:MAG: HlyD family efflux transporter periplasmic adaptor subunit, partial [Planctomycetota bacterium]